MGKRSGGLVIMTMQSLQQIVSGIASGDLPATPAERKPIAISARDAQVVNSVFERLKVIFPAWQRAFPTPEAMKSARQEWTKALVEAGVVTEQALALGFKVARERDIPFFPAPGQFIKWCKPTPEALGMPSVEQALHEVSRHRASHPAVVLAARATRFERETLSFSEYAPVFERAYEQLVRRVMSGDDINAEVVKALPSKGRAIEPWEKYQARGLSGTKHLKSLFKRGEA